MFDTNIFNQILDGNIDLGKLAGKNCCATHVQIDEIRATPSAERRSKLEGLFSIVIDEQIPTTSAVIGVSRVGGAKVSDGVVYSQLLHKLDQLNKSKSNNKQDALIAETALTNGLILVTNDNDLLQTLTECGGKTCNLETMLDS